MKIKTCLTLAAIIILTACAEDPNRMVGTLERHRIEVKVESNEPITAVHGIEGQLLAAGELILEQDSSRLESRLLQLQANVDQYQARLAELNRGPRQEDIEQARAKLSGSRAETVNAEANLKRARDIFNRGLSTRAALDNAQAAYETAVARSNSDRAALAEMLSGTTVEEIDQAEAALAAAQATWQQADLDRQRLQIMAPVAGRLDDLLFELGERPAPLSTVAILMADETPWARVYVPQSLHARVSPGVTLEVNIDGVAETFNGTVRRISADASFTPYFALTEHDRSRLSYVAEVDLPGTGELPSGLPLVARLPGSSDE